MQFLLNVMYFGLNSALTILAAQYWGRQDKKTIAKILGTGLIICMGISTAVTILSLVCPRVSCGYGQTIQSSYDTEQSIFVLCHFHTSLQVFPSPIEKSIIVFDQATDLSVGVSFALRHYLLQQSFAAFFQHINKSIPIKCS
ncbi:MAG: hypothetical protein IJ827_06315 [Lachnospiraceae bacterium]|nr:hypothetical protein [Lachnospiraceae bacterium]